MQRTNRSLSCCFVLSVGKGYGSHRANIAEPQEARVELLHGTENAASAGANEARGNGVRTSQWLRAKIFGTALPGLQPLPLQRTRRHTERLRRRLNISVLLSECHCRDSSSKQLISQQRLSAARQLALRGL
ncbi:unnamed protein product [Gadus morhua 'NCC']